MAIPKPGSGGETGDIVEIKTARPWYYAEKMIAQTPFHT
jgi:hypothetical protein